MIRNFLFFGCFEAPVCKIQLFDAGFGFGDILQDRKKKKEDNNKIKHLWSVMTI